MGQPLPSERLDVCPHCDADLRGKPIPEGQRHPGGAAHYSNAIGVEIRGVRDGVLFWACPKCNGTWHSWDPAQGEGRLWEAAQRHGARFTEIMQSPPKEHLQ
jgi:Zn-finger nucleic acid-binding protein